MSFKLVSFLHLLRITGLFGVGLLHDARQILSRPTPVDKIGYNSACIRDICEMFASNWGFSGSGYRMMSVKFYNDRPWLPWQRNLRQNRL